MTVTVPIGAPPASPCIALVGNPNTGKSALFNRLTGSRQRVGNFPGLTVEKKVGKLKVKDRSFDVVDLPGMYSLAALSTDEQIVLDVLNGRVEGTQRPDLIVCVLDTCNLSRHLFLASQLADLDLPMVIALNMCDEAEQRGIRLDLEALQKKLGVPIVRTVGTKGVGVAELAETIDRAVTDKPKMTKLDWPEPVTTATASLAAALERDTNRTATDAELLRMLFDVDSPVADTLGWPHEQYAPALKAAQEQVEQAGLTPVQVESMTRYGWIGQTLEGLLDCPVQPKKQPSESIDALLTHRWLGLFIFAGIMYLVFLSIYTFAGPLMDFIDGTFGLLGDTVGAMLAGSPVLQSLAVDGVVAGVGGVIIFLPQILILFFFIAFLEDAGYMARAAFLMDRVFGWCGLNGKSFLPMMSGYACAIPGVMATRTIEDPKARLTTILVAPLMSCSARLPVYVLLIGAFIQPVYGVFWASFTLFAMHFVGLLVSLPVALLVNRWWLGGTRVPFVMELPPYRVPQMRDVLWRMYERGHEFVIRAGTLIFAMSIVIWALCYFPRPAEVEVAARGQYLQQVAEQAGLSVEAARQLAESADAREAYAKRMLVADAETGAGAVAGEGEAGVADPGGVGEAEAGGEAADPLKAAIADAQTLFVDRADRVVDSAYLEQSYMGRMGKAVQPVFAPAGFDWKITVGVLASFPAREVIISTLGVIYTLGADVDEESSSLRGAMAASTWPDGSPVFTPVVAIAIMVFFALCMQCGATVAVIARETNWRWAVFSFVYMTVLAWAGAVVVYQVGSRLVV